MKPNNKQVMLLRNRQMTLLGQMNKETSTFYETFSASVRDTHIPDQKQEELLLDTAKRLVEAQNKGLEPDSIYEGDSQGYIQKIEQKYKPQTGTNQPTDHKKKASAVPSTESRDTRGISFNLMIAWSAISIVLVLMGFIGLVTLWGGQDPTPYTRISIFTLALIAVGAIVLIQVLLSFNNGPEDEGMPARKKGFQLGAMLKYLIVVVVILFLGYSLGRILPVIEFSSVTLLVIGFIGLCLIYPIFVRKRKK
ncbi:DUF1129 family protein [Paenibacillus sp. Marseille-Q4541]|uniref:DUF1129 family protein n=1 Tax=Paenibacillus sp. Marseille-Q4541 TaxID=2831522 RepID=UPI001BA6B90A|nr:DUF1129 family protein [Paenibacillus sp. Marseille-Q4541]